MKYFYTFIFIALLCAGAMTAHAQTATPPLGLNCTSADGKCLYTPLEPLPCPPNTPNCQSGATEFAPFVSTIFRLFITFGGLFAVVMLVIAGIGYMLSEAAVDIDKAKSRAKSALWGLLLLTGAWLILNTVNPEILNFRLFIPGSTTAQTNPLTTTPTSPNLTAKSECESQGGGYIQQAPGVWGCFTSH